MILVTGGTGFIGSYLLRFLVMKGEKVRALKRENSPMELVSDIADKVEWVVGDILDIHSLENAFEGVSKVYHCAAMVSFSPSDHKIMSQVNVEGTANVVNLAQHFSIKKLLHVSSIAAIGRSPHEVNINENSKWQGTELDSMYAKTKFRAECEVWRAVEEGLNAAIVNPAVVLGSGYWSVGTNTFFRNVYKGLKFYPMGQTGFVDVRDVIKAMVAVMDAEVSGERFILCSKNLSYHALLSRIAKFMGKNPPSIKVNAFLREVAWRVEWTKSRITGGKPMVTQETALTSYHTFHYHNEKIRKSFGFEFRSLDETLEETARQFVESKSNGSLFAILSMTA